MERAPSCLPLDSLFYIIRLWTPSHTPRQPELGVLMNDASGNITLNRAKQHGCAIHLIECTRIGSHVNPPLPVGLKPTEQTELSLHAASPDSQAWLKAAF